MPPKTKKIFTRHNSVKFVLITEGRDESGEKIKQNVLVPVPNNHIPENSRLFSSLAGMCAPTNDDPSEIEANNDEADQAEPTFIKYDELTSNQEADLENVLNELEEDGEIDFDDLREQMDEMSFFDNPNSYLQGCSNMRVEMIDEENSLLDGFSDSEFGDDYGNSSAKPKFASIKQDCPENIKLLDEAFKRYMKEKYNENCIGALDDKEINDATTEESEDLKLYVLKSVKSKPFVLTDCDNDLKEKVKQYAEVEQPEKLVKVVTKKPVEFDCESILSTYSNIHNHPTVIKEQSKIRKIRIPNNPLKKNLTKSMLRQLDASSEDDSTDDEDDKLSVATSVNIRQKGETPEQRRERKNLFKEEKRERRKIKKENKLLFKDVKKQQAAQKINVQNTKGIKLI